MVVPLEAGSRRRGNSRGSACGGRTCAPRRTRAAGRDPGAETLRGLCRLAEGGTGRLATARLATGRFATDRLATGRDTIDRVAAGCIGTAFGCTGCIRRGPPTRA